MKILGNLIFKIKGFAPNFENALKAALTDNANGQKEHCFEKECVVTRKHCMRIIKIEILFLFLFPVT